MNRKPVTFTGILIVLLLSTLSLHELPAGTPARYSIIAKLKDNGAVLSGSKEYARQSVSSLLSPASRTSFLSYSILTPAKGIFFSESAVVSPLDGMMRLDFSDSIAAAMALGELAASGQVESVQRNYAYHIDGLPNDSAFSSQWALDRIGIASLWKQGIFASALPDVLAGILDTGIDYLHPDLAGAIATNPGEMGLDAHGRDKRTNGIDDDGDGYVDDWRGYDWVDEDNDPMDLQGHGTNVAGIIGARANNGIGIAGIAPVRLLALRAFNAGGVGSDAEIAPAIVYAADHGVQVLNMSFGDVILSPLMRDVIRYAASKGVVMVASSGNEGNALPHYPSDFDEVISVGSVNQYGSRSLFSSYGPSLDLMAPGESIATTALGGGYADAFSGTSAAAPHVAGIMCLMKAAGLLAGTQMSPEELRATLLNKCEDLGMPGWDNQYGAGLVRAEQVMQGVLSDCVTITSPQVDAILAGGFVPVLGSASTAQLESYDVSFGEAPVPSSWHSIASAQGQHRRNDTLAVWNITSLSDGDYILRLHVKSIQGADVEDRVRVHIQHAAPYVTDFAFGDSVIIGEEYGSMVRFRTDRMASVTMFVRRSGMANAYQPMVSDGVQHNHFFLLSRNDFDQGSFYDFYLEAKESSGRIVKFPTVAGQGTDFYTIAYHTGAISTTGFTELATTLPASYLLNTVARVDGSPVVLLNRLTGTGEYGKLMAYRYAAGTFLPLDSLDRSWIPRDLGDINGIAGGGRISALVQDRGVTEILDGGTSAQGMLSRTYFADSADTWGSRFYDFDGNGKLDLVARSSSQFLIYRNTGTGFLLSARLGNPTLPLPSDALNQFGPPKSIVGDFSGSGKTEILFADYDGDLIMYRQTSPFQFELAAIDSSDLLETSDYLVAGDFDGDGKLEFASAGHTNTGYNSDREYDPPLWVVRVLAFRGGKIQTLWTQLFFGVNGGVGSTNGLSAGRVLGEARDQLLLNLNPSLYVFDYKAAANTFVPVWTTPSQSNAALVFDFNANGIAEFGIHANGRTRFYEYGVTPANPPAPWDLRVSASISGGVQLQWSTARPTSMHRILRDTISPPAQLLDSIAGTSYRDAAGTVGRKYFYAVSLGAAQPGGLSNVVGYELGSKTRITNVIQKTPTQVSVTFSRGIDMSRVSTAEIRLDDIIRTHRVAFETPVMLLVTFENELGPGSHGLKCLGLYDVQNDAVDSTISFAFSASLSGSAPGFYVRSATFAGPSSVIVTFSDSVGVSAETTANYRFSNELRSFTIQRAAIDMSDKRRVVVTLDPNVPIVPKGYKLSFSVSGDVKSVAGVALNGGKEQTIGLAAPVDNLDNLLVFPNPLRYVGDRQMTFANIPGRCWILIYTADGRKIREFQATAQASGITWDVRDGKGNVAGSGIYIYIIKQMDESGNVLATKTGKLAVIR